MNFKHSCLLLSLLLCVGCEEPKKSLPTLHVKEKTQHTEDIHALKTELSIIDTDAYVEAYIIRIINEGSQGHLGFSGGSMDPGFASPEDAPNIARYVMSLSQRKSSNDVLGAKSALFYTSNCGGCHGDDGKGLNGAFPDLTIKRYVGLEKRKMALEIKLGSSL